MDNIKKEVLGQKIEEIKRDFEKWLEENNVLLPGEIAVIKIHIEKTPTVIVKPIGHGKKYKYTDKVLQQEDWDKMFMAPLSKRELSMLDILQQNNNQPFTLKDMKDSLRKQFDSKHAGINNYVMNTKLSAVGFPYRLREYKENDGWFLKIFVIEYE